MTRKQIIDEVKKHCTTVYAQLGDWSHDLNHVKRVVKNCRLICKQEKLSSKDAFLTELAAWLHDLGRVNEEIGLLFLESNHAEHSYIESKKILEPYRSKIGREPMYKVLQAVREHSLPQLRHPENLISKILQDADRGATLNVIGILSTLHYLKVVEWSKVTTKEQARLELPKLTKQLVATGKVSKALEVLQILVEMYFGAENQVSTGNTVSPLHTVSARKLYKKDLAEIEDYMDFLGELAQNNVCYGEA
ncbi:MAG: HD domain-containing protein [Patescibacteria group bacterium]